MTYVTSTRNTCEGQDEDNVYPYTIFELEVGNLTWEDNMIIYCPFNCNISAEEFITKHYLTTLTTKRIPAGATQNDEMLHVLLTSQEVTTPRTIAVTATFHNPDGNIITHTCSFTNSSHNQFDRIVGNPDELSVLFDHFCQEETDYDWRDLTPLSYTVRMGQRSFTYYVDEDFHPTLTFRFRNAFNVMETIYLDAVTVTKTDTERSLATSHGISFFYDQMDSQEYEVTTAPLSSEEAAWASQLLLSHKVQRVGEDGTLAEVLITDMTAEVTDSDEELRRLKFTYRLARQGASITVRNEVIRNSRFAFLFSCHAGSTKLVLYHQNRKLLMNLFNDLRVFPFFD